MNQTMIYLAGTVLPRPSVLCLIAGIFGLASLADVAPAHSAWPSTKCPHVVVLGKGNEDQVRSDFEDMLVDPKLHHLEVLGEALDLLPEFTCKAVRRVAFVDRPKAKKICGWNARNDRQDLVYFNQTGDDWYVSEGWKAKATKCVVHESTHAAVRLLQSQQEASPLGLLSDRPDPALWPADVQTLARETIARAKLERGALRLWEQMHEAFVSSELAAEYYGGDWGEKEKDPAVTRDALAADGFASAYGGEQPVEDVSEISAWALTRGFFQATGTEIENFNDAACSVMNMKQGAGISKELSAVYAKLGFAQSIGLITEDAFDRCVQPLAILGNGPGFHSFRDGQPNRSYTGNVERALVQFESGDPYVFLLKATGTASNSGDDVPVQAVLQLDVSGDDGDEIDDKKATYPRGVYFVGSLYGPHNRFNLRNTADGTLLMEVTQGVLLVSRANRDLIEGSLFVQRYLNYAGGVLSAMAGAAAGGGDIASERTSITFRFEQ